MFLLRFVCEHLIKANNCCYGRCYGKSHTLPIRFLKFHCFNAGNRVRLFQESIPKCLKVTILPFKKSDFCNRTSPFFEYKTTLTLEISQNTFISIFIILKSFDKKPRLTIELL